MAIRQVGGKSVYIIDAGPVDSAKTSAGTGYAQLVSQLRWQIWEASKEAVAQQIEFEKMGYQAQLDVFAKQQAELQKSLSKLRDIKNKVASGALDPKDALRLAIADANTELSNERNELRAAGGGSEYTITETQAKTATGKPRFDENGAPVMIRTVRYKASDKGASKADAAKDGGDTDVAKPSSRYEDILAKYGGNAGAAIDARAEEIQAELSGLRAPSVPTIDTIGRTRQGFGEMASVGGFGFAKRPTKSSPIYDEAKARRELFGAESDQNLDRTIKEMADNDYIETKARILSLDPQRKLTPAEDLRLQQDALVRARKTAQEGFFEASAVTAPVTARQFMTGNRVPRGPSGPNVEITEAPPAPTPEPTPTPAPRRRPASPPPRDPAFQDFINRLESDTPPQDIEPYRAPPPPPPLPSGKASMAPNPNLQTPAEEELNFGGGVIPSGETLEEAMNASDEFPRPPSDLEIFKGMLEISGIPPAPASPPTPKTVPAPVTPAPVLPPRMVPAPTSKVSDIEIDIAEDNDQDIYRKALEYWKTAPDKRISTNPPAYFAGKKPGEKVIPGEGQREMVRAYLEQYVDEEEKESNKIIVPGGKLDPDLAREAEGEVADLYKKASIINPFLETLNPTEQEKQELYNAYQDRIKDVMFMSDEEIGELYIQKLNEIRGKNKPKSEGSQGSLPKTRQQRSASYALNIIQKGKDLASKPEKLARLAKTNLPEHERSKKIPEHIALVDKLYDINLSKGDVYKSTYSEIARVYEKQPKLRDAALEYLVAKNLMFGNIS